MIIEYASDGCPLWFSVKDSDGKEWGSNLLANALYQAIQHDVEEIKVIEFEGDMEMHINTLNVDKVLKDYYTHNFHAPLQYKYIEHGGLEYEE